MTPEKFEELQSEAMDLEKPIESLSDSIRCAADCETVSDFKANIEAAIDDCNTILSALKALKAGRIPE